MAGCAAGMPMYTKSSNTGVNVKAEMNVDTRNLLRLGALYQHYTLNDWWPPSGTGGDVRPTPSRTSTTASVIVSGVFAEWGKTLLARQWTDAAWRPV
jgi:iron complex outermembrane receptor protein